jgi:PAS domain S-box-containing protein
MGFEQLTLSILSSIPDPLVVIDQNQCVLLLNPAAEHVFNIPADAAQGLSVQQIIQSEELLSLIESKNRNNAEWTTPDNKTFVPRTEPIRDQQGNIEGWVIALRDITHYKKLNRNQNEFTRIVSHDLRSPLTSMQGFANMLELGLVGELNEKQAHFVEKILSGITQMTALVENIQDAGRYDPETGFYDLSRSYCDFKEIATRIVENHLVPAEKQELHLECHIDDNVPVINADMHMLERALTNLIDNAIKYTPNGGTISVSITKRDDQIIVGVSDTGYGISPENQKHLFERHVRIARQEHKKIKGSGLGLFIVRSVAQRHGGDAWVESVEGQGSTFFFSIPLAGANLVGAETEA